MPEPRDRASSKSGSRDDHPIIECQGDAGERLRTDEETKNVLTLFIGVMYGVNAANKGIAKLSIMIGEHAAKQIPKQALTKTFWFPIMKSIAAAIGKKLTKDEAGQIIGKTIPFIGAFISGGMTWVSFGLMSNKLKSHVETLYLHNRDK